MIQNNGAHYSRDRTTTHRDYGVQFSRGVGNVIDALSDDYVRTHRQGLEPQLSLESSLHRNSYNVNQRIASSFHCGRVFLAGDAAHVNNPLGSLGMNSGRHDAMNPCGKLLAVRDQPEQAATLFEIYSSERRGIATAYVQVQVQVQVQAIQKKKRLETHTPAAREAAIAELRLTAADPVRHKTWVMKASLLEVLPAYNGTNGRLKTQ